MYIVGRRACTSSLGLSSAGVAVDPVSGKIIVDETDTSTAGNIFAIGDVAAVSVPLH